MTIAENLRATHAVDERVVSVDDKVAEVIRDGNETKEVMKQVEQTNCGSVHRWLSPPDPSTNHNIACGTHHKKTATWFFEGNIYGNGNPKRTPVPNFYSILPNDVLML
ncbi:hypothetical protein BGY98DRAFT_1044706 [Russula aff. rugulosa BPL654]|nr:hypothetical protein BGY98DRAFT_1044706 [Russula aff. rugulosa BPL654]